MTFHNIDIHGPLIYEPQVFRDQHGFLFESYNEIKFKDQGIELHWVQDNQSSSHYGVIRGLHYQLPPFTQSKLVRVLRGKILDVIVDIRQGSPTFGVSYCKVLSAKNRHQLYIPKGFAHGFAVLSKIAEVIYKCDIPYNKESEAGISYNDASLGIDWRIPDKDIIISDKDRLLPALTEAANSFAYEGDRNTE